MNKNMYIGRLTKDPEVKQVVINGESVSVGKFSIAVTNNFKGRNGDYVTTFINNLTAMGDAKVKALNNLCKGRLVYVECHLMNNDYTDKDGKKVYSYDFVLDSIEYLDAKSQNNNQQTSQGNYAAPQGYQPIPQSNYQQIPQGGYMAYQPIPQGNYQQIPQGGYMAYQPIPQGNPQQAPQGNPQQAPQGNPQQAPQGNPQIPNNLLPPQSQNSSQPTLEDQFKNGPANVPDPNAVFGSGTGVAGSNFK